MVKHIVLFSFSKNLEEADILEIDASFKELPLHIPGILSFESGLNISPEHLNKGFTHIYSLTFADEKTRDTYLYHEAHQAFSKKVRDKIDDVLVVDYEVYCE